MKKYLLTFILLMRLSSLSPCDQEVNVRKAFIVVESALRHAREGKFDPGESDAALRLYYACMKETCEECYAWCQNLYGAKVLMLERYFDGSSR